MRSLCPLPFHKSCQKLAPDYTTTEISWWDKTNVGRWKLNKWTDWKSVSVSFFSSGQQFNNNDQKGRRIFDIHIPESSLSLWIKGWGRWKKYLNILLCYILLGFVHSILTDPMKKCLQRKKKFKCLYKVWFHFFISPCFPTIQCAWLPLRLKEYNRIPITTVLRLRAAFKMAEKTFPKTLLGFAWQ